MKNLQTGTTCLSSSTGSKQHKCRRSLQRLATFVILFLCSMTIAWAQEPFGFTQNGKKDLVHKSDEESITATFSSTGLSFQREYVKFARNDTGTLTIDANAATISNVSLLVSNSTTKSTATSIPVKPGDKKVSITDREMPVDWSTDNKKVIFKCSTTGDLYVFGATITYKYDDAGKLSLNEVSDPTITLNSTTTTEKLSFTINQTAKTQTGTSLETYYTTDGSNPNDTENKSTVKLTQNPQTVTIDWVKGNTVTVRTFTKRMDDSDAKNYRESAEARQEFTNTGSTDLASVDAPVITPGGKAVVATRLEVTISDKQWTSDPDSKLKVYYTIEEGSNYDNVKTSTWTEATKLPLTLELTKTSTVKAYAKYTADNGQETSSATVSCTYFLLVDNTTYLNTSTSQYVGTTVERNGMTMTFGGIKVGSSNFKALSKNDNTDANTLGSIHTVDGNALFVNVDVESELGDGNIGLSSNDGAEYLHCNASNKKLHENTFALPAMGSFFKFEPEANGKLTVFVEQQGAIHNVGGKLYPEKVRKRPVYFLDETGKSIPANYAYTSSKVNKDDWTKIQNTYNTSNDNFYTKEYMDKLEKYYQNIIDGTNTTFTNFNSAVTDADKRKALLGTSIQPIIVLHEECNADILKGDGMSMSETGDTNYDKTGYMLISEGYVTYEFPVKAGKTYYLFASRTKLALSGFCFDKDPSYAATDVTLDGNANNTDAINKLEVDKQYNVTLKNRTFRSGRWYSVVLPFSVSQKQMKSVFGDGVKVLHYSDVTGTDLNLFEHFYQMIVGGTPVLVKPSQEVTNPVFNNVTLTSKEVVDIVNTGFKCTGSWNNVDFPAYSYFIDAKTNSFYQYDPTKVETGTVKPHAGAFRSWIIASENASTAKQLTMHINGIEEQGETTAIWNAISGNDDAEVASKGIYSLSGQKMNAADTSSLPKGIYIVNGKKFIVK